MAQLSSLKSVISGVDRESERVGRIAGFGSIFGIIAAAFGLLIGKSLIPISLTWEIQSVVPFEWVIEETPLYVFYVSIFMGLIAASFLFQAIGSRNLGSYLGSGFMNVFWAGFVIAIGATIFIPAEFETVVSQSVIPGFLIPIYFLGSFFAIAWQIAAVVFTDSGKTWIGFLAGLLNALFIPVLAIGQALSPLLIYAAYGILLVGQLMSLIFWWSPFSTIREFARSPEKAKFAFGVSGVLTFLLGLFAVFNGPLGESSGVPVWHPWSILSSETTFRTNPALIFGLVSFMMFWVMLAPRLGARELKAAAIGEDIVKGGNKYFMLFLAIIGIIAAGQGGASISGVGTWGFFMVVAPAGVMFLMGAAYTAKTDMVTGVPLVVGSVFIMIHPYVLLPLVLYSWILIIITQVFLMIESWWRGLTGFSQGALAVIISLTTSVAIIFFMLGVLGSGPLALWPTNRWFNITLLPNIPASVQGPLIIVLPLLVLLVRNVSLSGYAHGRGYSSGGILMGISVLFAFMIPVIAGNQSIAHQANTGAALLLALYSISVVLVMSLNISLANDVEEQGHGFEGTLIKVSTISALIAAAVVIVLVLIAFAPAQTSPTQIATMISIMVTFVVGSETLSILGWLLAGIRLGMLKEGFSLQRV
ncbi:MAG: hypothetical protein ACFFBJ_05850 [Promethearchaeota archaeon]